MGLSSKNMSEYIKVVVKSKIVGHQGLQDEAVTVAAPAHIAVGIQEQYCSKNLKAHEIHVNSEAILIIIPINIFGKHFC